MVLEQIAHLYVPLQKSADQPVFLSPEVYEAVGSSYGGWRVIPDLRHPTTQENFSRVVGRLWKGLSREERKIFGNTILSPRKYDPERVPEWSFISPGFDLNHSFLTFRDSVRDEGISVRLYNTLQPGLQAFYFIEGRECFEPSGWMSPAGKPLSVKEIESMIEDFLIKGQISSIQAILNLNKLASSFPLNFDELSLMLGTTKTDIDTSEKRFQELMEALRARPVSQQVRQPTVITTFPARWTVLRTLSVDERRSRSLVAQNEDLEALCHDPDPGVIYHLLKNPGFGLNQARLVAAHHSSFAGLDALAKRSNFMADEGVRGAFLKNALCPENLHQQIFQTMPLIKLFLYTHSPEIQEKARHVARRIYAARFRQDSPNEKIHLLIATGGRCLRVVGSGAIDSALAVAMKRRTDYSSELILALAHYADTPHELIAHLVKLPVVRHNNALFDSLRRHKNTPPRRG